MQHRRQGYSPERINPGDEEHDLTEITKVVAGMDEETLDILAELYGSITKVYRAKDIRTAEADCVIMAVAHDELKKMMLEDFKEFMNEKPVLVDVRGMFDEEEAKEESF